VFAHYTTFSFVCFVCSLGGSVRALHHVLFCLRCVLIRWECWCQVSRVWRAPSASLPQRSADQQRPPWQRKSSSSSSSSRQLQADTLLLRHKRHSQVGVGVRVRVRACVCVFVCMCVCARLICALPNLYEVPANFNFSLVLRQAVP